MRGLNRVRAAIILYPNKLYNLNYLNKLGDMVRYFFRTFVYSPISLNLPSATFTSLITTTGLATSGTSVANDSSRGEKSHELSACAGRQQP